MHQMRLDLRPPGQEQVAQRPLARSRVRSECREHRQLAPEEAREGDVLVTMSSGSFDGMPYRLYEGLTR